MGWAGWGGGALIASKSGKVQPKKPNNNNKTLLIKIKIYKFKPLCLMHRGLCAWGTRKTFITHCNTAVHRHIYATSFTWVPLYLNTSWLKKKAFMHLIPPGHQGITGWVCLSLTLVNVITVALAETLCKLSINISLSLTESEPAGTQSLRVQ